MRKYLFEAGMVVEVSNLSPKTAMLGDWLVHHHISEDCYAIGRIDVRYERFIYSSKLWKARKEGNSTFVLISALYQADWSL